MEFKSKVEMDKVMSMTLDEYAMETGLYVSPSLSSKKQSRSFINKHGKNEDDSDLDTDEEEELLRDDSACPSPNSQNIVEKEMESNFNFNAANEQIDLRNKITGRKFQNNSNSDIPKANSQQWRLLYPNNEQKIAGMPPLIKKEALTTSFNVYNTNVRKNIIENNYSANSEYGNNNNNNSSGGGNQNKRNEYRRGSYQRFRNGNTRKRIHGPNYNKQFNYQRNHVKHANLHNKFTNQDYYSRTNEAKDIKIEVSEFPFINNNAANNSIVPMNHQHHHPRQQPNLVNPNIRPLMPDLQNYSNNHNTNTSARNNIVNFPSQNALQCYNGAMNPSTSTSEFNVSQIPLLATTLLDAIRNSMNPKIEPPAPKYDMELQKEIHCLQKKPMIYKCPSGDVISSDGPGLNLGIKPSVTSISMNQRFS